ncbi:Ubiquitin-conjugating enzyme/RWD-like protein [Moelleriella libera RCEF 2490]|uniref:Ubiquitin-conjugating enzyme/RWD-like protein n=1 Tax=Moelleriella libera RCEF 2490 TaxID=1081109 RepID=A0A168C1P8_9HYPO|nr:Ubiquitin-conjugating enzyme/RWD-like protein [Moelleriella libera RCEF 2490]
MGRDEQIEEREVLESIFPEEITDLSETEFQITIKLDVGGDSSEAAAAAGDDEEAAAAGGEGDAAAPAFLLQVRYTDEYPDAAPHLDLLAPGGPAAHPHQHFSIGEDRELLLARAHETVQENLGMAMVFAVVSTVKEAAEQLIQDRRDVVAAAREEAALAAEREENKKFHGTQVTPETFWAWRDGFLRELADRARRDEEDRLAELKRARVKEEPVRLTGKQLWQGGLASAADEDEGGDDDGVPVDGVEKLAVDAA